MKPDDCPKFHKCSAPICPLDPKMLERVHLAGERVCIYLLGYSKLGVRANLRGCIAKQHFEAIVEAYPKILSRNVPIKKACERASKTPSRLGKSPRRNGHG